MTFCEEVKQGRVKTWYDTVSAQRWGTLNGDRNNPLWKKFLDSKICFVKEKKKSFTRQKFLSKLTKALSVTIGICQNSDLVIFLTSSLYLLSTLWLLFLKRCHIHKPYFLSSSFPAVSYLNNSLPTCPNALVRNSTTLQANTLECRSNTGSRCIAPPRFRGYCQGCQPLWKSNSRSVAKQPWQGKVCGCRADVGCLVW